MAHHRFPRYKKVQRSRTAIMILTIAIVLCIGAGLEANAVRHQAAAIATHSR